uniref:Alpha-2-macroglobulin n=1 Tax=Naja naja TaxID=35670 RepID=A0A8C6VD15_NAJNA
MIQPFNTDLSPPTQAQISGNPFVFALLVPSIIYMETSENFCVQINNLKETLNLTLLLESGVQDVILNQVTVKEKDVFQCVPFQIPKHMQIEKPKPVIFIQTDKPIYRAGQEVQFRIVSMDKDLHPMKKKVNLGGGDPKNNRVFQWRDVETPLGIIQLSYSLSSDPLLGTYKVVVEKDSTQVADYSFEVDEYVLPKFELLVKAPKLITVVTKEMEVSMCGRYVMLNYSPFPIVSRRCKIFLVCVLTQPSQVIIGRLLASKTTPFSKQDRNNSNKNQNVLFFHVQVKLVDSNEVPISNGTVEILMMATHQRLNQVTDAEGRAEFSIETTNIKSDVLSFSVMYQYKPWCNSDHWITPRHGDAFHTAYMFYSPSKSYLHVAPTSKMLSCGHHEPVRVRYILNRGDEKEDEIVFYYMVSLQAKAAFTRHVSACLLQTKGDFLLNLSVDVDTAPKIHLLLYTILPSGELVAALRDFTVENLCLQAKLWFSNQEGLPGQKAQLHLSAFPGSLCAIHAVDQSVFLLKPEAELSPEKVSSNCISFGRIASLTFCSLVSFSGSQGNSHSQLHSSSRKNDVSEEPKEIALPVTIPDTITEWKAGAFCLSADAGFGLAQPTFLKAFQPFFIELTLPYSVVRGEAFPLKATVFSYLTYCIRVRISLMPSADFEASPMQKEEDSYCICANGRKTVSWMMTPKILGKCNYNTSAEAVTSNQLCGNEIVEVPTIGNKDVVIKSLLVEVYPLNHMSFSFPFSGDILGGAIKNLNKLLKMPYGCGEQNMALFAPNIYILNYLNKTGQLTQEIKSKAIGYLEAGYQRQLNYKHRDGSYSAFGKPYLEEGNTWLTAFVLKSFARARSIIFVEDKHINDAQNSLTRQQENDGCFRSAGSLFNNALKVQEEGERKQRCFFGNESRHPVVQNALVCLEKVTEAKEIHIYLRALLAYAFALAGKDDKRQEMLDSLLKVAVKDEDGSIHWERSWKPKQRSDFPLSLRAPSAEIELNGYVLLALMTKKPSPSQEELTTAAAIVKWLTKQQNPNGGYSSTQDTVVALQALSQYRTLTYSKDGIDARVTLSSGDTVLTQFHVDSNNSLLLQCQDLPQVPGNYKAEVTGCIFMQTALKYNVPLRQEDAPFRLDVHTVPETCTGNKAHVTFDIAMSVSYTGQRLVSNMAIVKINMLSGYIPEKSSIKTLEKQGQIQKSEVNINHVLLYLDEVRNTSQTFSFTVEQETPVRGLKPALVKVYDYYETGEKGLNGSSSNQLV